MSEEHSSSPAVLASAAGTTSSSTNLVVRPDTSTASPSGTSTDATHHDQATPQSIAPTASPQTQGSATSPSDPIAPATVDVTPSVVTSPPSPLQEPSQASEVVPTAVNVIDSSDTHVGSQAQRYDFLDHPALSLRPGGDFSVLSPSARTSHTRVDLSANTGEVSG